MSAQGMSALTQNGWGDQEEQEEPLAHLGGVGEGDHGRQGLGDQVMW